MQEIEALFETRMWNSWNTKLEMLDFILGESEAVQSNLLEQGEIQQIGQNNSSSGFK